MKNNLQRNREVQVYYIWQAGGVTFELASFLSYHPSQRQYHQLCYSFQDGHVHSEMHLVTCEVD